MIFSKHHSVEKDGTGIKAMEAAGLTPSVYSRANISQDVIEEHGRSGCLAVHRSAIPGRIARTTTWH
jgi:hypothetical protein